MGFFVFTPPNGPTQSTKSPNKPRPLKRQRLPEYLYQTTTGLLIFRMKVPRDIRQCIKKLELQYSLRTRCVYSARKHIANILPFLNEFFEEARQGAYSDFQQSELDRAIKEGIRLAITRESVQQFKVRGCKKVCVNGQMRIRQVSPIPRSVYGH